MRGARRDPRGPSSRHARCDWYYDLPLKRPEEAGNSEGSAHAHASAQEPRLGGAGDSPDDVSSGGRRKWFRDTDSDYVKLSKRGGQPDLLRHFTPALQEASPGPSAAMEGHPPRGDGDGDGSKPPAAAGYTVRKEFRSAQPAIYEHKLGPFDFDVKSVWKRDSDDEKERQLGRGVPGEGPPSEAEEIGFPATGPQPEAAKDFHRHAGPQNEPVNFSKLLSNAYGEEWFQHRDWEEDHPRPNGSPLPDAGASQPASTQTDHE